MGCEGKRGECEGVVVGDVGGDAEEKEEVNTLSLRGQMPSCAQLKHALLLGQQEKRPQSILHLSRREVKRK